MAEHHRTLKGRAAALVAAHAVHDTYTAYLPPLLPELVARFGMTRAEAGSQALLLQLPSILQPLIGRLADRRDMRLVLALAPALVGAAMTGVVLAGSRVSVAVFLLVAGLGAASIHALGPPMLASLTDRSSLGKAMGWWMLGGELGRTVGPVVVTLLLISGRGATLAVGSVGFLISWALLSPGGVPRRSAVLGEGGTGGSTPALPEVVRLFLPVGGLLLARAFLLAGVTTYLPMLLRDRGEGLVFSGAALTVVEVAGMGGALLGGHLSDKIGRKLVMGISIAGGGVLLLVLPVADGWHLPPLLVVTGAVSLAATPVLLASVQERARGWRSFANGLFMALSFGLRSLVLVFVGWVADEVGMGGAYAVCSFAALCGAPLVLALGREMEP